MLDMRTLFVVIVIAYCTFGIVLLLMWRVRRSERTMLIWALSNFAGGAGCLLTALRGLMPDWLSISGGNGLLGLTLTLMWAGLRQFAHQRYSPLAVVLPPVLLALLLGLYAAPEHFTQRVCISSGVYALIAAMCLRDAAGAQRAEQLQMRRVAMSAFAAVYLALVLRYATGVASTTIASAPPPGLMDNDLLQVLSVALLMMVGLIWNLAVMLMPGERLQISLLGAATHDPLTQVLNRAGFQMLGTRLLRRNQGEGSGTAVLLMDLDRFKQVNDRYGHAAGDDVLVAFAASTREALRPTDLIGRHGGEEFCALLTVHRVEDAMAVAERIRSRFEALRTPVGEAMIAVTVSIGVAMIRADEPVADAALVRADRAMYRAKRAGRNRVECYDDRGELRVGTPDNSLASAG